MAEQVEKFKKEKEEMSETVERLAFEKKECERCRGEAVKEWRKVCEEKKELEKLVNKEEELKKRNKGKVIDRSFERELNRMEDRLRKAIERTIEEEMEGVVKNIRETPWGTEKKGQGNRKKRGGKEKDKGRESDGGDGVDVEAPALPLPALIEIRGSPGTTLGEGCGDVGDPRKGLPSSLSEVKDAGKRQNLSRGR